MVLLFTETTFHTRRVGCYRIATILRSIDVEVEVIDFLSEWNVDELIKLIDKINSIEWVGFSLTYSYFLSEVENATRFTDLSKEDEKKLLDYLKSRSIPIVLGGSNADSIKNFVSGYYVVIGYADNALAALHRHIVEGLKINLTYINNNKVIYSDINFPEVDLSKIETVFTENDLINDIEMIPIEISRGCIFKCKFCEFPYIGKKPGTYIRTKESIAEDIKRAYYTYGIENFLFVDDTFNDSIEKMQKIADIRRELCIPFKFWSYGRLDLLSAHPKMIDLIEDTGWSAVTFGVETLNKKSGSKIGKGADPERLKNTLLMLRKRYPKMHIQINLITGLVDSTKEDIRKSVDWFLENSVADYIKIAPLHIQDISNISSGSEFAKNPNKFGYQIISTDRLKYKWKNNNWNLDEAKKIAKEMTEYINTKNRQMKSYHYDYHVQRYLNSGFNRVQILSKLENFSDEINYIQRKKQILAGYIK